ncbi:acetyl-CoA acetyltransferase, cytosolic [Euwallacea similis]|uniref:acetyl-CoA acetyltransferase, cytosolic n=1 Tax=Euwallacea similis TaxID=1736056 RepID=UPI0034502B6A
MTKVFIVSGCRTPIGNFQGQFERYPAPELGSIVIGEAIARANLKPEDVDQCIMGHVLTAGLGQNPARQAAINAKIPYSAPSFTVNMLCGSGLKTVALGYQSIKNGDASILVAGGQESMTRAQHSTYLRGAKLGALNLSDTLLSDGLTDAFNNIHMGNTAEHLAKSFNISREAQDEFAVGSQAKAVAAINSGFFDLEIVAVPDKRTKALIVKDEFPKPDCTLEKLAKLRPAFESTGTVTAGNASGINDGAAAVVLANEEQVAAKKLTALAEIVAFAEVGLDPVCMGLGPIEAVKQVLKKAQWTKDDVGLYELNEAFAVQSIICIKELGLDASLVNVTGGAVALGHPIGASGTRCLVTLIHNLRRLGKQKGVVALCIGGGMGIAMAVQVC